jgi:PHD/YefM family antitoxin component YafN of YafNO toxin-antitoxin module
MKATKAMTLHPEILKKNGKNEFVVLPYEEFLAVQERLTDADDLRELRQAKRAEGRLPSIPLAEARRLLAKDAFPAIVREKPAKKYGKKP